jgi:hypothetical protein
MPEKSTLLMLLSSIENPDNADVAAKPPPKARVFSKKLLRFISIWIFLLKKGNVNA